jgi:hypothetical protein
MANESSLILIEVILIKFNIVRGDFEVTFETPGYFCHKIGTLSEKFT